MLWKYSLGAGAWISKTQFTWSSPKSTNYAIVSGCSDKKCREKDKDNSGMNFESLCAAEDIGSDKIIRKLGIPNRYYYIYTSHNYIVIRLLFMIYRIVISVFTILLHYYVRHYLSLFVSAFIMTKIRGALFRSTFFPPLGFCAFRARKKRNSFAAPSVSRAKHHQNFPVSRSMRRIVPRGIRRTRVTLSWVKNAFERGHSILAIPSRRYSMRTRYRAWYYGISAILDPVFDVVRKY